MRTAVSVMVLGMACLGVEASNAADIAAKGSGLTNSFFAFDNGVGRGTLSPEQQAEILADFGYHGIGYTGTQKIPEALAAFERQHLKMFSTYIRADIGPKQPAYEEGLPEAIRQLKGHGTLIWLHVHGGKASDDSLDDRAVDVIREIADMAAASELRVALYPHVGFYVATVQDAVRLAKKVDRENVGASFNLCHFLKLDDEANLREALQLAKPYLFAVSINGADSGETKSMKWDRLIQTLDQGSFDVYALLKTLREIGYDGPIGLQCYGVQGDVRENLKRSMDAWQKFVSRMEAGAQ